jgi:hypothetical protein
LNIERQDYVAVSYPVQPVSPFAAFPIDRGIAIQFAAGWESKTIDYVIRFPKPDIDQDGDQP